MSKEKKTVKALYVHSGVVIRPESDNSLEELKEKLNKCGIKASLRVTYDTI
jgi:hypothetical protein